MHGDKQGDVCDEIKERYLKEKIKLFLKSITFNKKHGNKFY